MTNYLCGCDPDQMKNYSVGTLPNGESSSKHYDEQGFEICPWHGQRLHGWRSNIKHGGKLRIKGNTIALAMASGSLRDNRDPETIGLQRLAQKNGH